MDRRGTRMFGLMAIVAVGASSLPADQAHADGTAETSVIAALGLTAASGKTTLGAGAGAIEAGLLGSGALDQAGGIIAGVVNQVAAGQTVLVLAHDETDNLITPVIVADRINDVQEEIKNLTCKPSIVTHPASEKMRQLVAPTPTGPAKIALKPSDAVAAIATDTTINAVPLTADDRLLIDAVLMNAQHPRVAATDHFAPITPHDPATLDTRSASFVVPSEATALNRTSQTYRNYRALVQRLDAKRSQCATGDGKAAIDAASVYVTGLNAAGDKGAPSPLASAIQSEQASAAPFVLRLAIEQDGGTAISRASILYTLGLPGAAMISSGLLVSFRLMNPKTGTVAAVGLVRCAVAPQNIRKVQKLIMSDPSTCTYRTAIS